MDADALRFRLRIKRLRNLLSYAFRLAGLELQIIDGLSICTRKKVVHDLQPSVYHRFLGQLTVRKLQLGDFDSLILNLTLVVGLFTGANNCLDVKLLQVL